MGSKSQNPSPVKHNSVGQDRRYNNVKPEHVSEDSMKTEKFSGTIESAYGKPVSPALKFEGEYSAFENVEEVRSKNEYPSDDEIVTFVNNKKKANARQKAMQAALDGAGYEKPTLENDPQLQLRTIYKALVASGKSEAESRTIASATLGIEWAE